MTTPSQAPSVPEERQPTVRTSSVRSDPPSPDDRSAGQRIGCWTLSRRLGSGASGETWRATRADGEVVALKLLAHAPSAELRALAQLCHPAIPGLVETAVSAPWYLAMELAPGVPLATLEGERLPPAAWLRGVVGLFDALATVHAAGLRHGDIKPDNVMWDADAPVPARLLDFGLCEADGGTALFAAPERFEGHPASQASDVYALGLVVWQGLCGALPFADRAVGEGVALRRHTVPTLPRQRGPAWIAELLSIVLHPDPARRPTAAEVVDRMRLEGCPPPAVDGRLIRSRAQRVRVPRRSVDGALRAWLRRGGHLVLTGPRGSGRRRTVAQVAVEVWAQGRAGVRLWPSVEAWGSVEAALASLGERLPAAPDDATRVERVVARLEALGTTVVVADLDGLDPSSRAVVEGLAQGPTPLLVSAERRPSWARSSVETTHCDGDEVGALLAALLGDGGDRPATRRALWRATRGLAGDVVELVVASVECGALRRSGGSWVLDESRMPMDVGGAGDLRWSPVGPDADRVATALAWMRRPVAIDAVAVALGWARDRVVVAAGALHTAGQIRCEAGVLRLRPGLSESVRDCDAARDFDGAAALERLRSAGSALLPVRAWLAVGTASADCIAAEVPRAVAWWTPRNPHLAARLAEAAWSVVPDARLAVPRMRALLAAGHVGAAREAGVAVLQPDAPVRHTDAVIAAMVGMAELECHHGGSPEAARAWCRRADALCATEADRPDALRLAEAQALSQLGDHAAALDRVGPIAERRAPSDGPSVRTWLRARTLAAQSLHRLGQAARAIELLESIPSGVGEGLAERAVARAAMGRLLWFAGQMRRADAAMTEAGRADGGLPMLDRARLLNNLGAVRHHAGARAEAVGAWEEALVLFERLEAEVEGVRTRSNLCVGYKDLGRWERSRQAGRLAIERAAVLGLADLQCNAALNLAELHLCRGQLAEAEVCLDAARAEASRGALERELVEVGLRTLELEVLRGRPGVEAGAGAIRREAERVGMVVEACLASAVAALGSARAGGTVEQVESHVRAALEPLQAAGAAADLARARIWVAEALLEVGRVSQAAEELDRARAFAREQAIVPLLEQAEALDARLATLDRDSGRDRRIDRLVAVAVAINEQSDLRDVFEHIAEAGLELLGGDRAFVLTGDPPQVVGAVSKGLLRGRPSMSVVRQAIADRREVIAADVDERGDLRDLRSVAALELRSVVCVPMAHHDEVIGAIYVDSRTATQQHLWESAELMRGLAAMAAVAVVKMRYFEETVAQARVAAQLAARERVARELADKNRQLEALNQQLRASAITDPLTGIGNRRHMVEALTAAMAVSRGGGAGFSVIVADIDHFKRINDTWGHQVGDDVLVEVARRIRGELRNGDQVYRYGGEELVIITRATRTDALYGVCERVRRVLAERPMAMGDDGTATVTASVGASALRPRCDTRWEEILQRADAALYLAKQAGRDRSVVASEAAVPVRAEAS